jgi:hypothetical protein
MLSLSWAKTAYHNSRRRTSEIFFTGKKKEFIWPQSNACIVILCTKRIKQNISVSGLHACCIPVLSRANNVGCKIDNGIFSIEESVIEIIGTKFSILASGAE